MSRWNRISTRYGQLLCLGLLGLALTSGDEPASGQCYLSPCNCYLPCCTPANSICPLPGSTVCPNTSWTCCVPSTSGGCTCPITCWAGICPQGCLIQCGSANVGTCGQKVQWTGAQTVSYCPSPGCPGGCTVGPTEYLCYQQWQCTPGSTLAADSGNPAMCTCPCVGDGSDDNCVTCNSPWGGTPLLEQINGPTCQNCLTN
jgi:hypothetical protein